MTKYEQYIDSVKNGGISAGIYTIMAVDRFINMRNDDRFIFDKKKVNKVIRFFLILRHFIGKHSGERFVLQPWQEFIVAAIYGFYYKDSGLRVVNSAYIEMARKQGKTAFAAGLCLYHEIADGENGAEVYLAANSRDQAKIAYKFCSQFAMRLDEKSNILKIYRDYIDFNATASTLKVLAADSSKLDGPNPSMYLLDEFHAAKNSGMKDVLQSGQGTRENPMSVIITTAGFDKSSPCYIYRESCIDVLKGSKEDNGLFAIIYSLDEDDDWRDEKNWIKSNPNLGVTVRMEYLRSQVQKAINSPIDEVGVRTKNINQWCDSSITWIPDARISECSKKINISNYQGRDCYVGIDLSSVSDITAVSCMIEDDGKFIFFNKYYLPEDALNTKENKQLYSQWVKEGYLTLTQGNVVDYDYILSDLLSLDKRLFIVKIGYDSWNSTQFVINATDKGLPMEPVSQSIGNFNRPTKEIERAILSGNVIIENNPITRFCFANVIIKMDHNGNAKPSKESGKNKIDGVIAMIEAMGVYLMTPQYSNSI